MAALVESRNGGPECSDPFCLLRLEQSSIKWMLIPV